MSIADCSVATVSQLNGIWRTNPTQLDPTKVTLDHGLSGGNAQFFGDSVMKRLGHSSVFSPSANITTMVNWLFQYGTPATSHNFLAWFAVGVGVQIADLSNANPASTIQTVIADTVSASAFIAPYGSRIYVAFLDANGNGRAPGQVYGYGVGADPLFAATITTVPTVTETGFTGQTTPGAKLIGYVIQTRNGYITRPAPAPGDQFAPVAITVSSSGGIIQVQIPMITWPSYAKAVAPIMSTTANPAQFFIVPQGVGGESPFYGINPSGVTNMFIFVTDNVLTATGIDATPYLTELSQTVSGTAPLNPSMIFPYGQRMGYITLDSAGIPVSYISDSSLPQQINAANNAVYLPGNLDQTMAYSLRGVLYIAGPHWTFSTSDSGGYPATWAQPQLVDGAIGAIGQFCVTLNASQNYAWDADEGGLYLFTGGSFPERPISYYQKSDWQQINFTSPNAVQVVDDKTNQRVHVLAPLNGATSPNYILTWDYSLGPTPEQVKYAGLSSISGYSLGAIAIVQNNSTNHLEKWIAPSSSSLSIGRENTGTETYPYRDFNSAIDFSYEVALVPSGAAGRLFFHHGARLRIRGSGTVQLTTFGLDGTPIAGPFTVPSQLTIPPSTTLTTAPGAEILQRYYAMSEYVSIRVECAGLDDWCQIAKIDEFYTGAFLQR